MSSVSHGLSLRYRFLLEFEEDVVAVEGSEDEAETAEVDMMVGKGQRSEDDACDTAASVR
jgi:hypothetical protein